MSLYYFEFATREDIWYSSDSFETQSECVREWLRANRTGEGLVFSWLVKSRIRRGSLVLLEFDHATHTTHAT